MNADAILKRLHELEEENRRLRALLSKHGIAFEACAHDGCSVAPPSPPSPPSPPPPKVTALTASLSLQEKVELFQSLFKGREDVFAKRWYSAIKNPVF